jgi:hypothetical protein
MTSTLIIHKFFNEILTFCPSFFTLTPLSPLSHKWARGNSEPAGIAPFSHSWEKGKGMRGI